MQRSISFLPDISSRHFGMSSPIRFARPPAITTICVLEIWSSRQLSLFPDLIIHTPDSTKSLFWKFGLGDINFTNLSFCKFNIRYCGWIYASYESQVYADNVANVNQR